MKKLSGGYTLMELIIVIVIMTIILAVSFYFIPQWGKKDALEKDVAGLSAFIRDAQMLSVTSKNAMPFGIHLQNDKVVLFEGSTYVAGGANEKVMAFSNKVYLYGYSLNGGGSDIIFTRLTGATANFGTITLSLKDNSASTTVTVLQTGIIQ
ncbi:MAG: prepilin-type N-terminal cleavage/methylation domain-containing protein [Patescibacteria group bacterium]